MKLHGICTIVISMNWAIQWYPFCCWLNFDMAFGRLQFLTKLWLTLKTILRTSFESSFYAYHNGTIPSLRSQSYILSAMISFNSVSNYHTHYSPGYDQYLKTTATNTYQHTYRCTWTSQERSTYRPWTNAWYLYFAATASQSEISACSHCSTLTSVLY